MYELWHDYIKPEYQQNAKLCNIEAESFIIHIFMKILQMLLKKDYQEIKIIFFFGLMKDALGRKIMT